MDIDPDQARKLLRAYRGARLVGRGIRGHRKLKDMVDDHAAQSHAILNTEEFVGRVREKRVHPEDVRSGVRMAVNNTPRVLRFVVGHIRKAREAKDA